MWLYLPSSVLPSTSSPSAPASAGSNSDCNSPTIIADRLCTASVTWRGKQEQPQAWSRRWKRGGFIRLLSGLTLEPSTAQLGADAWISSLRATRAKEIRLRESAAENSTTDGCSTAPSTFSIKAGLILSSARTCRGTPTDSLPLPSRHWSDWVAALRSEYSARPKPAIRCGGSDSSSWPSARTSDTNGAGEHGDGGMDLRTAAVNWPGCSVADSRNSRNSTAGRSGSGKPHSIGDTLCDAVKKWSAPKASDAEKAGPNMRGSKGYIPLPAQAMNWAGPAAQNHKGSSEGSIIRQDGKSRADILSYQAEQFFHPPSSPDQPIIAGGSTSSTDSPNSNQPSVKRKLNPIFVEALMRWPTGLSGFERQEMALILWSQLMPSFLSMLVSPQIEAEQQMEMFS